VLPATVLTLSAPAVSSISALGMVGAEPGTTAGNATSATESAAEGVRGTLGSNTVTVSVPDKLAEVPMGLPFCLMTISTLYP
jgi:hypothetical protein